MLKYEDFIKRNHVTKAIRFELVPQGKTAHFIKEHGDYKQDKALYDALDRMKPVIDSFIRNTASKALKDFEYSFEKLHNAKIDKDKKTVDKEEKTIRKALLKCVDNAMPEEITVSQINSAKFLQDVLAEYVESGEDTNINKTDALSDIKTIKGTLPLFSKFLTSRITALTTWMSDRVLENFDIYRSNIQNIDANIQTEGLCEEYMDELRLMAEPDYYREVLSQEDIEGYNRVISGTTEEKGLNQLINEYNIAIKSEKRDEKPLRYIKPLYKQSLMPQEKRLTIESINTDDEVRKVISDTWTEFSKSIALMEKLLKEKQLTSDGEGIIVAGNQLHQMSHLLTGDHNHIPDRMMAKESAEINEMLSEDKLKPSMKKELEKRLDILSNTLTKRTYELTELDEYLDNDDKSVLAQKHTAFEIYVGSFTEAAKLTKTYYKIIEGGNILKDRKIKGARHVQEMIVDLFDSMTEVRKMLTLIAQPDNEDGDAIFYNDFEQYRAEIRTSYKAENLVRNYITKSTKDIAETKQTCLGTTARLRTMWWNGEGKFAKDNAAIIRHEGKYYYFILSGDAKPIVPEEADTQTGFLTLKKGQASYMMLPKILFTKNVTPYFKDNKDATECVIDNEQVMNPVTVTKEAYDIYTKGHFKKEAVTGGEITEEEYRRNVAILVDTYKEFAREYVQYEKFDLTNLKSTADYNDIGEFFSDVDTFTSKLSWIYINFEQIEQLVESGDGYLFLISNRFLYTGRQDKNLYTKTLLALLSDANMGKTTMLLNSNPGVFYRPAAIEKKITHKKGSFLVDKTTEDGKHIPKAIYETIYKVKNNISNVDESLLKKAEEYMKTHKVRSFRTDRDIARDKRYMEDKLILQLTYTKNNDVSDRINDRLNDRVNEAIKDGYNMVSVSRSTTDLVYVMAAEVKDNEIVQIFEERSLNVIDGMDYHALLSDTYKEKVSDKKAWIYTTDSGDVKSAYIDMAITEVLRLAKKYNAVIIVEGISDQVKDKYSALDNQVFKTFEKRIAERLSDLALKDVEDGMPGSVSNPLQLSNNSGNTYQDGILFFVNGAYTRGVDPESGFVNIFDLSRINSIQSKRQFFSKMNDIRLKDGEMTLSFDYAEYPVKYDTEKTKWKTIIGGDVVSYNAEKKKNVIINDIVDEVLVPAAKGADLSGNLAEKMNGKYLPGSFVDELYRQFRYSLTGIHRKTDDKDEFFKSPTTGKEQGVSHTSAYNLARKFIFRQNYEGSTNNFTKEWINHIQ
jgi:CRISPR-associated protein Cpf1